MTLAQTKEPVKVIDMESNATRIVKHPTTGTPIVFTPQKILGFNPETREINWSMKRSGYQTLSEIDPESSTTDYLPYASTPYSLISSSLVNVVTGDILLNKESEEIRQSFSHFVFPEKELLLLELGVKGKIKLYGIDIFESKLLWGVELTEMSGLKQKMNVDEKAEDRIIKPQFTPSGNLLYQRGKDLVCIDMEAGKLLWKHEYNPGFIQYEDDNNVMLVANKQKGFSLSMIEKFGRILHCINPVTGESYWKETPEFDGNIQELIPFDGGILVVHDRGANIFDMQNGAGKGRWKKDYELKGIRKAEITDEGLSFSTKKEQYLVDPSTGADKWKKPKKLERTYDWSNVGVRGKDWYEGKVSYQDNEVIYTKDDQKVSIGSAREKRSDERGQIVTLRRIYNDKGKLTGYSVELLDAKEMTTTGISLRPSRLPINQASFVGENRIFLNSDQSFRLLEYKDGDLTLVAAENYKEPGAGTKRLGKFLLGTAYIAGGTAMAIGGADDVILSNDSKAYDSYTTRLSTYSAAGDMTAAALARKDKSQSTKSYAYFFTKDKESKEKDLVLKKIEKESGEEVEQFKFTDKTPVYKVDEENNLLYYSTDKQLRIFELN